MWGGWYDDPLLMEALTEMRALQEEHLRDSGAHLPAQAVFLADERAYANLCQAHPISRAVHMTRIAMGNVGASCDIHMVEEAEEILSGYRAAIFPAPVPSEAGRRAMAICREKGIHYLSATVEHPELDVEEIQAFLKKGGVHLYSETDDVVYAGNGYVALHAKTGGEKHLSLPTTCRVTPLFGADIPEQVGDHIHFPLEQFATALFKVSKP